METTFNYIDNVAVGEQAPHFWKLTLHGALTFYPGDNVSKYKLNTDLARPLWTRHMKNKRVVAISKSHKVPW